ncbi:hypothetical protein QH494_24090 [Sphingomonas sp. AR_OL41]|jgi:hypothetical protein|uniref:hypothetical protein n=1 Tax=Sphingomonas sp. AR_OL41 TaxID=3042729 RepID=UPI00248026D7|nr:hypothetical protein [Sphingomonas sp. AR_OL41]MDH7975278.1 hypothetical protein [Sphingomonas sp. AR_OL41]
MIAMAMLLAAQSAMPIKYYPGWELYRYDSGCTLVGHFGESGVMQIADNAGAYRTFIGISDPRFDAVAAGQAYAIAPVPLRDGAPDRRYTPISARGTANGYTMTLKGDRILDSMAKSQQIRFALADGGSVMTLNYGPIAAQLDDLRQCAQGVLRGQIGSPTQLGAQSFAPMSIAAGPQYYSR